MGRDQERVRYHGDTWVIAFDGYTGKDETELTFNDGEVFYLCEEKEGGMGLGILRDKSMGWFPMSHVSKIPRPQHHQHEAGKGKEKVGEGDSARVIEERWVVRNRLEGEKENKEARLLHVERLLEPTRNVRDPFYIRLGVQKETVLAMCPCCTRVRPACGIPLPSKIGPSRCSSNSLFSPRNSNSRSFARSVRTSFSPSWGKPTPKWIHSCLRYWMPIG